MLDLLSQNDSNVQPVLLVSAIVVSLSLSRALELHWFYVDKNNKSFAGLGGRSSTTHPRRRGHRPMKSASSNVATNSIHTQHIDLGRPMI